MQSSSRIEKAVDQEEFVLHYQPIIDRLTSLPVAAEALLRWSDPQKHKSKAGEVAANAEEGAAIFPLDDWAMQRACSDAVTWAGSGAGLRLNLNLSAREFYDAHIFDRLTAVMKKNHFEPSTLNLEVTETSAIEDPEKAMKIFDRFKKLGVQIWLDDFGTGHSSLAWLRHFPVDGLKIPDVFVKNLATDQKDQTITRAIIAMARELGLKVIAEGVETRQQADLLEKLECDMFQGFLFFKALPIHELCRETGTKGSSSR